MGQGVERHGDAEVIFELSNQFQDLQRIEAEVGEQFAGRTRIDGVVAEPLEDFQRVAFEPVRGGCGLCVRRALGVRGVGSRCQAGKCNTNVRLTSSASGTIPGTGDPLRTS